MDLFVDPQIVVLPGLVGGPVDELVLAHHAWVLLREALLLPLVLCELSHQALILPEPREVEVHPTERAPRDPLQLEGVNAGFAGRVTAGADEEGRPLPGVEAGVADLADDVLLHRISTVFSSRGCLPRCLGFNTTHFTNLL